MEPLTEAGRIFFVSTRLYYAALYVFWRLWDEGWLYNMPDVAVWRGRLEEAVQFASQLEGLPFEVEPAGAGWLQRLEDAVQPAAELWARGDFLFELKGPPDVDPAVFALRAFLTFMSQVSVIYVGLVTSGHRMAGSPYPDLFEAYQNQANNCIGNLITSFAADDNDNYLPVPVSEELSIATLDWALDWHGMVLALGDAT